MKITTNKIPGTEVSKVILESEQVIVELLSLGAGIRRIAVKNLHGTDTLTQSFTDYREYIERNTAYNGKTLAPNAGRFYVSEGINLGNGQVIHPEANERGINSLHGSRCSVSIENWTLERTGIEDGKAVAIFTVSQPDGLCGWPGNRDYRVVYNLSEDGVLRLNLSAETDTDTYFNMSNHAYWNLNLNSDRALEQYLSIQAESVVFNNDDHIPYRVVPLEEIVSADGIDFSMNNRLKDIIPMDTATEYSAQMRLGMGLNNAFIFKEHNLDTCLCRLSGDNGHCVEMYSDAPAMVIYSSGCMDEGLALEDKQISKKSCSVAFEFQELPTLGNPSVTHAGETFRRTIIFKIIE